MRGALESTATQQCTRVSIGDGERVAAGAVADAEVALEVDAPDVVGLRRVCERRGARRTASAYTTGQHQAVPLEERRDRAHRWQLPVRLAPGEPRREFARSPARMILPQSY